MKSTGEYLLSREIASMLLQIKAIKLSPGNPFTWASGIKSPIYCDNRIILSHPEVRGFVTHAFIQISKEFSPFDLIAGVATSGIAFGALVAHDLKMPMVYVRSSAKQHGRQNLIEGEIKAGSKVLIIEDLISTGQSSLHAFDAIQSTGNEVKAVLSIFNYGFQMAIENFCSKKCKFSSITHFQTLINEAIEQNYITESELTLLMDWRTDPRNWYSKHFG
ncbi:MAG TPA: orotate phosphoribosyltransferase [Saprospiraceae bacterium]|nr:orotate phosphoribosyltransferase [Saprospiraceae bacterium]